MPTPAIISAVESGEVVKLTSLLSGGANVNERDPSDGATALHRAARIGQEEVVKLLVEAGGDPVARDCRAKTPLHEAAAHGPLACCRLLLASAGARSVDLRKTNNLSPLHCAAAGGHAEVVKLLLASSADVCARDKCGETPLHLAARTGAGDVVEVLLASGAGVDEPTGNRRTSLHVACLAGHAPLVHTLLRHGANIESCDVCGSRPVHEAAAGGHVDVLALLLDRGADWRAVDSGGCTPLFHAVKGGHVSAARTLLSWATAACIKTTEQAGHPCGCQHIRVASTGEVVCTAALEARDTLGSTPLYWASSRGQVDAVRWLLAVGADASAANHARSPLHVAAGWGHVETCQALVAAGASLGQLDQEGHTPQQVALASEKLSEEAREQLREILEVA